VNEKDPVEEEVVEEVPSVEPHVAVLAAAATPVAPAAGFHFVQERGLEATAEAETPYDEQAQEEPIPIVVEVTVTEVTGDGHALEACFFFFPTFIE